jgi:hypothetical protein
MEVDIDAQFVGQRYPRVDARSYDGEDLQINMALPYVRRCRIILPCTQCAKPRFSRGVPMHC